MTIFIVGVFFHYRVCFLHNRGCLFIIVGTFFHRGGMSIGGQNCNIPNLQFDYVFAIRGI